MNEIIETLIDEMKDSLKRAEHSCYVSLKYTRTVDVLKNLVERFITTISFAVDVLSADLEEKGKIMEQPDSLIEKVNLTKSNYEEDETITAALELLLLLRKIIRADYGRCEEFRRHVTMVVKVEGEDYHLDIDLLTAYFHKIKEYVGYIERLIKGENEDQ
ncbi:hypothetical protein HN592_00445 [Candidatus Woesearchaeota archaeon]|jgi:hypothetical protein|nr:hypothetical protein [Candidatus Woesearchaeota archaeon]MBT4368775.1 hypothetical protein [Candidatus Woesearchaeota archaeon]MBT4712064.1 hypothetical protein [Candidatus Woesearchaeota archaeon]MBT6639188.1 hypothetical protein [Candidatus Woesearchaeota archaeon]MBT7134388.1 hypothetical protein [Candidatus Woesearchaeota archaeon]